jgi:hypothetical protein
MPPTALNPNTECDQKENPHPVNERAALWLGEEYAQRYQATAGQDEQRSLQRVDGPQQHRDTAEDEENS